LLYAIFFKKKETENHYIGIDRMVVFWYGIMDNTDIAAKRRSSTTLPDLRAGETHKKTEFTYRNIN